MATAATHRVNFINKNQARSVLARLFKHIAHAARANTHKHLHEIRSADAEKRRICFAGNSLRQQSLSSSRRSNHQNTLRNASPEPLKLLRVLQKFDQLRNLL